MFDSAASIILVLFALVAFNNYRNGTLGQWLGAKFLNRKPGQTGGFASDPAGGGDFGDQSAGGAVMHVGASSGLGAGAGLLAAPIDPSYDPTVTGKFGDARTGHTHEGVDLAVPTGTPIDAARGGTVIYSGPAAGYGYLVTVDHGGGITTRYGHFSKLLVRTGQTVNVGDQLGLAGATGDATGPHLHFEYRINGSPVDPWPMLAADYGQVVSA